MSLTLKITEIFYSLQGETRTVGLPTVFVRLTGCPLRCTYCDTAYAFVGGQTLLIETILTEVMRYKPQFVTVTGGEPLAQPNCQVLLQLLCDQGLTVSLETSGALPIKQVDPRVNIVMDIKTPSSAEVTKNYYDNIQYLKKIDQIKFVIGDEHDYVWAKEIMHQYQLPQQCEILFSPSHGKLANHLLADWIIKDNLPVRFQLQLHKYVWGDVPGH